MTTGKKVKRTVICLGLVLALAGALIIFMGIRTRHYTATITKITDTTGKQSDKSAKKNSYSETVKGVYVDSNGKKKKVSGIEIIRSKKSSLPGTGKTIEITDGITGAREYRPIRKILTGAVLIIVGVFIVMIATQVGRKKKGEQ